jgi:DNA-binding NarL/FixJ family response regulator
MDTWGWSAEDMTMTGEIERLGAITPPRGRSVRRRFATTPRSGQLAVLVVAYEPVGSRATVEAAMTILAEPASLEVAIAAGLLLPERDRLTLAHPDLGEIAMRTFADHERRAAHLALAGVGVSPTPIASDLTDRELDVTELATSGLRTKEIADRLHLSPKTVEYHLSNVFRKLGVRSRTELGHLLRRAGAA